MRDVTSGDGPTVSGGVCSLHYNPLPSDIHIGTESHRLLSTEGTAAKKSRRSIYFYSIYINTKMNNFEDFN